MNISENLNVPANETWRNVTTSQLDAVNMVASSEIAVLSVILIIAVLGNVAILIALYVQRRKENQKKLSRIYFFILHLTLADLITAFLNVLPQLLWKVTYRFAGGAPLCKVVKFGQTLGPYLMSYILVATALDRHQAICYPLTYCAWSSRRSRTMVAMAWALTLVFSIPQITIFSYQQVSLDVHDCWASFPQPWGERLYVTWYSVSVFIVPLLTLGATYTHICRQLWLSAQRHQPGSVISRAKVNTVKQTVTVIVVYVVCTAPFICALLWASWDKDAFYSPLWSGSTLTLLTLLSSINSCVNPLIYLFFNAELSRTLCDVIRSCAGCKSGKTHRGVALDKTSGQTYVVGDREMEERGQWGTIHEEDESL